MSSFVRTKPLPENIRFKVADKAQFVCRVLGIDRREVIKASDLPDDFFSVEKNGVSAKDFFRSWSAIEQTYGQPDFAMKVAMSVAYGLFSPATLAYAYSRNIQTGLERLTEFEPILGPFLMAVRTSRKHLTLRLQPAFENLSFPASFSEAVLIVYLEKFRRSTGVYFDPISVGLPTEAQSPSNYFGCEVVTSEFPWIRISLKDAQRPLISESTENWQSVELELRRRLSETLSKVSTSERLRNTMERALPAGETRAESLAQRLGMSKRSLHRKLEAEGSTFSKILDETRSDLAQKFLKSEEFTIEEVSRLLGFKQQTSFSRAFRRWVAMSPSEFRIHLESEPS